MKTLLLVSVMVIKACFSSYAQNLLDLSGWGTGSGTSGMFAANGQPAENIREWGIGPDGKSAIVWKSQPDGDLYSDGGWNSSYFAIDNTKMYRFTVWMKKSYSASGISYFGCNNVLNLDNSANNNPYFWVAGGLPELDKWYLLVGYIHGSADPSMDNYGGVYDTANGAKVAGCTDFKFSSSTAFTNHRAYLYYDPQVNDRQYFYSPRVDVVNGEEPAVEALLGIKAFTSVNGYFSGNVGIGTTIPDQKLTVKGNIHAQEVKVDLNVPGPDYVFKKEYNLPTLKEVETYISQNQHLPEIASAKEMKDKGIELGEMNMKLLKKIEELTLYMVEQNKKIEAQNLRLDNQQEQLNALRSTSKLNIDKK